MSDPDGPVDRFESKLRATAGSLEARRVVSHCTRCSAPVRWYVAGDDAHRVKDAARLARVALVSERRWCGGCRALEWAMRRARMPQKRRSGEGPTRSPALH